LEPRLLRTKLGDPYSNVAAEEAIYISRGPSTLRLWENQRAVVIGRGQLARLETDLALCDRMKVPVVRRMTAGGAVYHGEGNLNWSFFVRRDEPLGRVAYAPTPPGVFASCARVVVAALESLAKRCAYVPPNTVTSGSGKVSGMAAYLSREGFLCHGTMLLRADLAELSALTTPSSERADGRYPRSRPAPVANLGLDAVDFAEALVSEVGVEMEQGDPTAEEESALARLVEEKYSRAEWNLGDPFGSDEP
jgi:lipoate---protein ligase